MKLKVLGLELREACNVVIAQPGRSQVQIPARERIYEFLTKKGNLIFSG